MQLNTGAKQYSLGFDHNMSKRTTVYALYSKLNNDDQCRYGSGRWFNGGVAGGNAVNCWQLPMAKTRAFSPRHEALLLI